MENTKKTNTKRTLLISSAIILLCMIIIAGVSLALFADMDKVSNHLKAGELDISLKRIGLIKTDLDANGYLVTPNLPDTSIVNFSDPANNDKNVFDVDPNKDKIVPKAKYTATMMLENNGDVACGYWVEIKLTNAESGQNLAKQIRVIVNDSESNSDFIGNGLTVKGTNGGYIGYVTAGGTGTFTVTVEFLDSFNADNGIDANDKAQGEQIEFDLLVHAVQATENPNS